MPIADAFVAEFDHEMSTTQKLLERVPDHLAAWKPHAKSMSLGELAIHIATLAGWAEMVVQQTEFDVAPTDGPAWVQPRFVSTSETVQAFANGSASSRAAIAGATDADLMIPWTLKAGAHTVFTQPRATVLRSFVFSHIIHHRGQLSVYLRLNDVAVPAIYGPSADER